jgi:hypothetical protein
MPAAVNVALFLIWGPVIMWCSRKYGWNLIWAYLIVGFIASFLCSPISVFLIKRFSKP